MNNASLLNSLRLKPTEWDSRNKEERQADQANLHLLAQAPVLEVFLRWLVWQKGRARSPVDLTQINWQETALVNKGRADFITEIANLLQ